MSSRAHIVLVPGFAGFDALGQIQYYAGTTDVFREWLASSASQDAVLHYFDNLPSGAVKTRAKRLRKFLAKRVTRNEFQPGDSIALVGHSTGGLDIRQLIADLQAEPSQALYVDGHAKAQTEAPSIASTRPPITGGALLAQIKRVVFISTPHHGSNLPDAIARHPNVAKLAIRLGRLGVSLARVLPRFAIERAGDGVRLDSLLAMIDALREADVRNFKGDRDATADALEARAQLSLLLDHMVSDFAVIDDLLTRRRFAEGLWPSSIATRSYASVSRTPSRSDQRGTTDVLYRSFHALTRRGAFRAAAPVAQWLSTQHPLGEVAIDDAASDGVVNTRSMFWEHGGLTKLVAADHGDIIGHYRLAELARTEDGARPPGRRHDGYDFFKSGSQFTEATFRQLWQEIFAFCAEAPLTTGKPLARTEIGDGSRKLGIA